MALVLLSHSLFLQVLHEFAMFLMEHCGLSDLSGFGLTDGFGTGSLGLLKQAASGCFSFLNCY